MSQVCYGHQWDHQRYFVRLILFRRKKNISYIFVNILQFIVGSWNRTNECLYNFSGEFNTLRPRQNGSYFPDDIFKCILVNDNSWISIKISLKFVPEGPINNIPALVQMMARCRPVDKPLSEPMMVWLPTMCVSLGLNGLVAAHVANLFANVCIVFSMAMRLFIMCNSQVVCYSFTLWSWSFLNSKSPVLYKINDTNLSPVTKRCPWLCISNRVQDDCIQLFQPLL